MTDWINWHGGECPVGPSVRVEVDLRDGYTGAYGAADDFRWGHDGTGGDIIRYRILDPEPQGVRLTEAQFEALVVLMDEIAASWLCHNPNEPTDAKSAARTAFGLPAEKEKDHD